MHYHERVDSLPQELNGLIEHDYPSLISKDVTDTLQERFESWKTSLRTLLVEKDPFKEKRLELLVSERYFQAFGGNEKSVRSDLRKYKNGNAKLKFPENTKRKS